MKKALYLTLMASTMLLSGCTSLGMASGVGAAVGVSAAKEGGIRGTISDEAIRLSISDLWFRRDVNMFGKLNLNVNQGRVLVTGVVQSPEDRVEAIRLAWQPEGVKQVINEIRIGESATLASFAKDTWISGQLRTQITFDKYIQSINYSIETVRGAVYLMGVAQSQDELDRVIDIARKIGGVKEVISYVKFLGAPVEPGSGFQTGSAQGVAYEEQQGQLGQQGQGGSVPYDYNDGQNGQPVPLAGSMEGAASGSSTGYVAPSSVESEMLPP